MSILTPFPIIVTKEGKWFVASCPLLDIATQGKSEDEVKENMVDLINITSMIQIHPSHHLKI